MPPMRKQNWLINAALAAFVFYLGWNLVFLFQKRIPPGIFQAITGLPSPTTGCVRALRALASGDVLLSLAWNPLTLPYIALLLVTACDLARKYRKRLPRSLAKPLAWLWLIALGAGWIIKLATSPAYW